MARRTKSRKSRQTRKYKLRGGGLGQSYSFGAPIVPGLGNSAEVIPGSSCLASTRPGMVATPTSGLGLPGLSGGARRRRTQKGGRYSFDLSAPVAGGTPWGTGIPPVMRIPCEGATPNPLNPVAMRGGAAGGLGASSLGYFAPTAGYGNAPSGWVASAGAPVMVQTPYDARAMNQACLKTGGGRRLVRKGRKGDKGHKRLTRRRR
jgi:hypothetical protein